MIIKFTKLKIPILLLCILPALVVMFSFTPHAHAAVFEIKPVYQVLSDTSTGIGAVVASVWRATINLVDSLVILALIAVAFANILRYQLDSYAVKKFLPTFIMAVILANFSFLISRVIVDIGNMAISLFIFGNTQNNVSGAFDQLIRCKVASDPGCVPAPSTEGNYYGIILVYIVKQWVVIAGAVLIFILSFLFMVRNYVIYFMVSLAPIAFMAMILPATKKYFQMWWSNFTKWVFMPVISVFWLWIAGMFLTAISTGGTWFLPVVFAGLCYYLAITSPFKIGGAVTSAWAGWGKKAWGATGGQATGYAKKRIGEEYGFQKQKATNWVANKPFVLTRAGWKKPREVAALTRQRLAGPSLVSAKQQEDANYSAMKYYLDQGKISPEVAKRYNSELRSRYLKETQTYADAGVDTLLDDNWLSTADGVLAMPTGPGKELFTDEEKLKEHMSREGQIKKLLARNPSNQDRRRLVAGLLAVDPRTGNTLLGKRLGQQIGSVDPNADADTRRAQQELIDHGLDTLRAPDMGPYGNKVDDSAYTHRPETADNRALIERDEAGNYHYRLRGAAAPAGVAATTSSAVPAGTVQAVIPEMQELTDILHKIDDKIGAGSLGGEDGISKIAAELSNMKVDIAPDSLGIAFAKISGIKVDLDKIEPAALDRLMNATRRVQRETGAMGLKIEEGNATTLRNIAQVMQNAKTPEEGARNAEVIVNLAGMGKNSLTGETPTNRPPAPGNF